MSRPAESELAGTSISGAMWFVAQTLVVKSSTLISQLLLAYLLTPDDFGLIAVSMAVAALAGTLFRHGLAQILVERAPRTRELAQDSFWLSMSMGLAGTAVVMGIAPIVADIVGEPEVRNLTWILALAVPIQAASVSPRARLLGDLQFGRVARINGGQIVLRSGLTVVFAWWGWGAYSFAIAEVVASLVELSQYRRAHPLEVHAPRDRSEWRSLTRDTALLVFTGVLAVTVAQGDYFILSAFAPAGEVGLYYFAYRLSIQGVAIFTSNLGRVLFPALSQLPRRSERQHRAFLRAVRAIAAVGVPFGVLGAVLGRDIIVAVFDDKWRDAGVLLQILSVAAVVRTVSDTFTYLLTAQGRFRDLTRWSGAIAVSFLLAVTIGAWADGAVGVAIAVAIHVSLSGWVAFTLTVRPGGGGFGDLPRAIGGPVIASALPAAAGLFVATAAGFDVGEWRRIGLITAATAAGYLPLLRVASPSASDEVHALGGHVVGRLRRRPREDVTAVGHEGDQEPEDMRET